MDSPMVNGTEEKRDRYSELPNCVAYEKTHTQQLAIFHSWGYDSADEGHHRGPDEIMDDAKTREGNAGQPAAKYRSTSGRDDSSGRCEDPGGSG